MRSKLILFAAVCVAALALSTPASAATILAFSQISNVDFVNADRTGSTTTLNTNGGVGTTNSIPILVTQIGNTIDSTHRGLRDLPRVWRLGLAACKVPAPVIAGVENGFNGTIIISSAPFDSAGWGQTSSPRWS